MHEIKGVWVRRGVPGVLVFVAFAWMCHAQLLAPPSVSSSAVNTQYFQTGHLNGFVRTVLESYGTRYRSTGLEREILVGTLTSGQGAVESSNVVATLEYPQNFRLDGASAGGVMILSGSTLSTKSGSLAQADYALLDSLANDSLDHFAAAQIQGSQTMISSIPVKLSIAPADQSAYRVAHVFDTVLEQGKTTTISKAYCIRSDNQHIGRVMYRIRVNGSPVDVQTIYSNWLAVKGVVVPGTIARYENGALIFSFTVKSATIAPAAADNLFVIP